MKKLLFVLFVGLFTAVGSFASAGFVSDSEIINIPLTNSSNGACEYTYNNIVGDYESLYWGANYIGSVSIEGFTFPYVADYQLNPYSSFYFVASSNETINCSDFTVVGSTSPISWVDDTPVIPDSPSNSDNLLNPGVISSGVQSGVSAFTNGLGNLIPTLLIIGLPVLIIMLFRKYIRSWLKHIIVVDKPRGDDVFNCNLKMSKDGNIYHDFTKDGVEYVYVDGINVEKEVLPDYLDEDLNFDKLDRKSENVYYNNYWDNLHYMGLSDDEIDTLFENDMKSGKTPEEASSMSDYDRKHYDEYMEEMAYEYGVRSKRYKKLDDEYITGFKKHNGL